jgi:hypothetical protein
MDQLWGFLLLVLLATTTARVNVRQMSASQSFSRAWDFDGDQRVTRRELVKWNVVVNDKYPASAANATFATFFRDLDRDGDAAVSRSEFVTRTSSLLAGFDASDDDAFTLQLHLSWSDGYDVSGMRVSWVTFGANSSSAPLVRFYNSTLTSVARGTTTTYNVGLLGGWNGLIHSAELDGLAPASTYTYAVSTDGGASWSGEHNFTTRQPQGLATYPASRWAVLGDAGAYFPAGYAVMDGLLADMKRAPYDAVMHVGDLAYATSLVGDSQEIEKFWDFWCEVIAPVAARVPYMISVGNHEDPYNYTSFMHRFQMPYVVPPPSAFYYAQLVSGVLWLQIDTQHGTGQVDAAQLAWLQAQLSRGAADPTVHWIIVNGHRPQVCSDKSEFDSHNPATGSLFLQLEPLFRKYEVDLYLCGHMHMFEFVHPLALNGTVVAVPQPYNGLANVYVQPAGTVRVVQGTGGIFTFTDTYVQPPPAWSFARSGEYGFGRLTVHNSKLLQYEFVETSNSNKVNHAFYIAK